MGVVPDPRSPIDAPPASPGVVPVLHAVVQGAALVAGGVALGHLTRRRGAAVAAGLAVAAVAVPYAAAVSRHDPYPRTVDGARRWLIDATWSAPNTLAGAAFLLHQRRRGNVERPDRSRGSGSLWLERSAVPGFATTIGIVKAGSNDRVDAHEDVHVHQARLLGPAYLPLVALDYVLATLFPFWLLDRRRHGPPIRTVSDYFLRGVYREVWHERWAYAAQPVRPAR